MLKLGLFARLEAKPGKEDEVAATYPMRRLGRPDDIASTVAHLLSDDAGWITGQAIVVDGGLTLTGGI